MKQKILRAITILSLALLPALSLGIPAYAACNDTTSKQQILAGITSNVSSCDGSGVTNLIGLIVQILGIVVGAVAIIMIIVSGFRYITSGGDSGRVSSAKNTLIYALIGLAIAVLAQLIVHFVLFQANTATLPPCTGTQTAASGKCR